MGRKETMVLWLFREGGGKGAELVGDSEGNRKGAVCCNGYRGTVMRRGMKGMNQGGEWA